MAFKDLDTRTRYDLIRAGVRAGITKVSDIERLFDEGGDLTDDEQKQLEWSKNWHTQRTNYMPWTDEQKAAYLRAIDKTYSDNNFTRSISKPMGFYHKDGSININYDNAENTTYGDMAKKSGLVHEIAHKLSFNANQEFNRIDNTIPEQEAAMLRARKLSKFVNPLEVGGIANAKNFVDYNTSDKIAKQQEKEFRNGGVYRYKNTPIDKYGHNAIEVKAKLDEARYRLNLHPSQMDIKPESVEMWRGRGIFPSSLEDYSNEEIANMLNTFAYNGTNDISNLLAKGGAIDPILKNREPKAEFYKRLKDPNRKAIKDWESDNIATHKMAYITEGDKAIVYPEVQNINGKLVDFTRPPYDKWAGYNNAIQRGDTIQMAPKEAKYWTQHYKDFYPNFNY